MISDESQHQRQIDAPPRTGTSFSHAVRHEVSSIERPLVSIVDDDESVHAPLAGLVRELGFTACAFSCEEAFLSSDRIEETGCLILDIAMPGMSGPELQRELKLRRRAIRIVCITARRDETIRPRVLEQGAVKCLFKPFSDTALLEVVNATPEAS